MNAGGFGVTVTFGLLRRFLPYRPPGPLDPPLTDEERRSFQRWEVAAVLPFFAFTAALTYLWYGAFREIADQFDPATPATKFLIRPGSAYWFLPAFFLGIISSALPTSWLLKLILGERSERCVRASNERIGFEGWPVFGGMAMLIVPAAVVAVVLGARTYARFDDGGIEIVRPLAAGVERHDYSHVAAIEHRLSSVAPLGNTIRKPYHLIHFADGSSWSTRESLRDADPVADAPLIAFVAARSGRPITEVP